MEQRGKKEGTTSQGYSLRLGRLARSLSLDFRGKGARWPAGKIDWRPGTRGKGLGAAGDELMLEGSRAVAFWGPGLVGLEC